MTTKLDQRISRAEARMRAARSSKWAYAWQSAFKSAVSARNAIAAVGLVRHPASSREELTGLRQVALRGVAATSGEQSMTDVGGRAT